MSTSLPISGYVLAGGRSSRMGTDKAFLQLAGKPLIAHAVAKLRRICADVHILGSSPALADYAPLVPDLHLDCGPVGGIEAALAHSPRDWNLILPVDVPFLPATVLESWAAAIVDPAETARVAMFTVDGRPQAAVCLLHKEIVPSIAAAVALNELKLLAVLEASAEVLALQHERPLDQFLRQTPLESLPSSLAGITSEQQAAIHLWFANLNAPGDFAEAEAHIAALDI
jgi:molybdopterin-guanine dinucleotide biosynthesis protein A